MPNTSWMPAPLQPCTQPFGLFLGDRMCLATAARCRASATAAHRTWAQIQGAPPVEAIR